MVLIYKILVTISYLINKDRTNRLFSFQIFIYIRVYIVILNIYCFIFNLLNVVQLTSIKVVYKTFYDGNYNRNKHNIINIRTGYESFVIKQQCGEDVLPEKPSTDDHNNDTVRDIHFTDIYQECSRTMCALIMIFMIFFLIINITCV